MLIPASEDGRAPEDMTDQEVLDAYMAEGFCLREAEDLLLQLRRAEVE
jgi:hypothetical protein